MLRDLPTCQGSSAIRARPRKQRTRQSCCRMFEACRRYSPRRSRSATPCYWPGRSAGNTRRRSTGRTVRIDNVGLRAEEPAFAAIADVGVQALLSPPLLVDDAEVSLVKKVAERLWADIVRARAEASLRESEERFRQFADTSAAGLWIRTADTLAMEFVSPAISTIYGVEPDALLGGRAGPRQSFRMIGTWHSAISKRPMGRDRRARVPDPAALERGLPLDQEHGPFTTRRRSYLARWRHHRGRHRGQARGRALGRAAGRTPAPRA